ncbi:MAG TPA: hypothetical protein VFZ65_15885 [Planctomycetota bacterium]|nr:hypothetical protein [Planctomycetota bacterium]
MKSDPARPCWRRLLVLLLPFLPGCAAVSPAPRLLPAAESPVGPDVAATQAPPGPAARAMNQLDLCIGGSYWSNLGDLDTNGAGIVPGAIGEFDTWGWALDLGYDHVVMRNRNFDWSLGLETGWSTFESNGRGVYSPSSDVTASMWYIAPATRWHFPLSPRSMVIAGVGVGYYGFAIDEVSTYYYGWWYGYDSRTLNEDGTIGGFASVAFDYDVAPGAALRLDNKVHFVHYEGLNSLLPNESSVDGPIWTFELGIVIKF